MRLRAPVFIAAALAAAFATPAGTTPPDDIPNPIKWSLKEPAGRSLKRGDRIAIRLTARVERGWHLYAMSQPNGGPTSTRIFLNENQPFRLAGEVAAPKPKTAFDDNFDRELDYYDGEAVFTVPVEVAPEAAGGRQQLTISARFQSCSSQLCLPPRLVKLQTNIEISAPRR